MVYRQAEHYRLKPMKSLAGNILGAQRIMDSRAVTDEALIRAVALITHAEQVHSAYGTALPLGYDAVRRQVYEACIAHNMDKARSIVEGNDNIKRFGAARAHLESVSSYCQKLGISLPKGFNELEIRVKSSS
ncbi:MAG TPA: hypothetical protein VJG30_03685 [Candidatus Nanoarchaeia archaeon]|nr:hypothetical protein [Candidatus Nanoarchaeia archaeon]